MDKNTTAQKAYYGSPDYKGEVTVIPVIAPDERKIVYGRKLQVAAYIRVSTESEKQEGSLITQEETYERSIKANPEWEFVKIYKDDGISALTVDKRKGFLEMIEDAKSGKIDLILTKSISRFARNLGDLLNYVKILNKLNPPVEVQFETDRASTFGSSGQLMLTLLGLFAEEESRKKSEAVTWAIDNLFAQGKFYCPAPLGFDKEVGRDKPLTINEEEAKTVKLCYAMTAEGYSFGEIATTLNRLERRSKLGNIKWTAGGVMALLMNEKNAGDLRARKTITNFQTQQTLKNEVIIDGVKKGYKPQYYITEHHAPIVPPLALKVALRIIKNRNKRSARGLPCLKAIPEGALKGFVVVSKNLKGYSLSDYIKASSVVDEENEQEVRITAEKTGVFDFRAYETVSPLLFDDEKNRASCVINNGTISFNAACRMSLAAEEMELLFHPQRAVLAIRQSADNKDDVIKIKAQTGGSKSISFANFMPVALESADLQANYKYRIYGTKRTKNGENIMLFDLSDAQILSQNKESNDSEEYILPVRYAQSYGREYYSNIVSGGLHRIDVNNLWQALEESRVFDPLVGQVLELKEFSQNIMVEFGIGEVKNE